MQKKKKEKRENVAIVWMVAFRAPSHYAWVIWKRIIIYSVRPTVQSANPLCKPEEFENAGFSFSFGRNR